MPEFISDAPASQSHRMRSFESPRAQTHRKKKTAAAVGHAGFPLRQEQVLRRQAVKHAGRQSIMFDITYTVFHRALVLQSAWQTRQNGRAVMAGKLGQLGFNDTMRSAATASTTTEIVQGVAKSPLAMLALLVMAISRVVLMLRCR